MRESSLGDLSLSTVRDSPLQFLMKTTRLSDGIVDVLRYKVDGHSVVLLNHPDLVQGALRSNSRVMSKQHTPDEAMLAPLLGDGLLTATGESWRRQRIALAPLFRRARVAAFDHVITDAADELISSWRSSIMKKSETRVEHELSSFTLSVLVRAIFGMDLPQLGTGFGSAVQDVNARLGHGDPRAGDATSNLAYERAATILHGITDALIAAFGAGANSSVAFLNGLKQAQNGHEIHDQVLTLIMAGHETTAKVLCWALLELGSRPDLQEALEHEARAVAQGGVLKAEHLPHLSLAGKVFREALRLHPPIWLMSRTATENLDLNGCKLNTGELVTFSQYLLHRDPRFWADPDIFDPKRENASHQFAYFPFGGGERLCIGQHLAELEGILTLATLSMHLRFGRSGPMPDPEALVTLRPIDGGKLTIDHAKAEVGAA